MSARLVRQNASTSAPLPPSAPAASNGAASGTIPMPTITRSADSTDPSASRTPQTRPRRPLDALNDCTRAQVDASRSMFRFIEARERLAGNPRQDAGLRLEHDDGFAQFV